jgi:GntR family transcriptional regulator
MNATSPVLDRTTPVPLHHQVAEALRAQISEGTYKPGDLLPPETVLATDLGLSRATVRQAIGRLVADGLLTRRRGIGTTVAKPDLEEPLSGLYTFAQLAAGWGQALTTRVLGYFVVRAGGAAAAELGLRTGIDDVIEIERVRLLEGEPVVHEEITLPKAGWRERLTAADLTQPLYVVLEDELGVVVTSAKERIRPVNLGQREARLLHQPEGAAAFHVERTGFAGTRPVEWRRSLIRGDRYLYSVELTRGANPDM